MALFCQRSLHTQPASREQSVSELFLQKDDVYYAPAPVLLYRPGAGSRYHGGGGQRAVRVQLGHGHAQLLLSINHEKLHVLGVKINLMHSVINWDYINEFLFE